MGSIFLHHLILFHILSYHIFTCQLFITFAYYISSIILIKIALIKDELYLINTLNKLELPFIWLLIELYDIYLDKMYNELLNKDYNIIV